MFKKFVAIATVACLTAAPASAVPLVIDGPWEMGILFSAADAATDNGPYSFTALTPVVLTVVDQARAGDVWGLSGDISGVTTFYAGSPTAFGASEAGWTNPLISKLELTLAPGSYSFNVYGVVITQYLAGVSLRVDTAPQSSAVPEPLSWAMMTAGLALTGAALRARKTKAIFAA